MSDDRLTFEELKKLKVAVSDPVVRSTISDREMSALLVVLADVSANGTDAEVLLASQIADFL